MRVINLLPQFLEAMEKWKEPPSKNAFEQDYLRHVRHWLQPMLDDFVPRFGDLYEVMQGLNWVDYRAEVLTLRSEREESRLLGHVTAVESLLGTALQGESILFGAFTLMDGYARFDRGRHRVYLGVDESHGRGAYLDVLITHELTHVAREALPSVWAGFGLDPHMTHDEFVASMPVIEHLMSEGFSCVVSEILNPKEHPWNYVYQTEDSLGQLLAHGPALDKVIHAEIADAEGDYRSLYDTRKYVPELPRYGHYVWTWQWVKNLVKTHAGGDAKKLLGVCAKDLVDDALSFKLRTIV